MANDDLLSAAQRRKRTGRSFFPAVNQRNPGSGYNETYSAFGNPNVSTIYQGGRLAPQDNPAYQAAISRPRLQSGDLTTITLPSGGTSRVPTASVGRYLAASPGSTVTQIGNQLPIDRAAVYAKGYGAATPSIIGVGAPNQVYQKAGGVYNPIENLTPQARIAGGVGSTFDYFRSNPALTAATNALSGFGQNIARWFGGGAGTPSIPPAAGAAIPSPTPYSTPVPSPTPTATPFKTASDQSDLLRDTEGTFYGGGHVPIPTPTPTPYAPGLAYGSPRRYSDNFGYA